MGFSNVQSDNLILPEDFDECLGYYYGKAIHPEDLNEVACQLAGLLDSHGVSVAEAERVLGEHNTVTLTPESARQLAVEIIRLHREKRQKTESEALPGIVCKDFADD